MENREVRLIDANALDFSFPVTDDMYGLSRQIGVELAKARVNEAPTIDPESLRPHGKWVVCSDGYYPYCSECKEEPKGGAMTNYCPNCGAVMQGVKDE